MRLPFRRKPSEFVPSPAARQRADAVPEGLFEKCHLCAELVYVKELERNHKVCPKCDYHHRLDAHERIALLIDEGSFVETNAELRSTDFLDFRYFDKVRKREIAYAARLAEVEQNSGLAEGAISGYGSLDGRTVVLVVMDLRFFGASTGSVIGEKVTRSIELAVQRHWPLVIVSASGGMRMHEGLMALMQMARTAAALTRLGRARIPFVSLMTDQTYGGVSASWGALGDVIIAEPGTKIGFAGPRVIEQTIGHKLPAEAQTAAFQLKPGMIDMVVHRGHLKETISLLLTHLTQPVAARASTNGVAAMLERSYGR